ncbi:helix-turn-helix domain-containing protein [Rhizobium sp. PAMB 3174]
MLQRITADPNASARSANGPQRPLVAVYSQTFNRFEAGSAITIERKGRRALLVIREGCVALHQTLQDGRRQILDILGPGRVFGKGVTDQLGCHAEALAFTRIETIAEDGRDGGGQARALVEFTQRLQDHITLLGRRTAQERVALAILDLAGQFGRRGHGARPAAGTFRLYLKRVDLADWLGLTLETVSRNLNGFKRAGLIDFSTPELVTIKDRKRIAAIAGAVDDEAAPRTQLLT